MTKKSSFEENLDEFVENEIKRYCKNNTARSRSALLLDAINSRQVLAERPDFMREVSSFSGAFKETFEFVHAKNEVILKEDVQNMLLTFICMLEKKKLIMYL